MTGPRKKPPPKKLSNAVTVKDGGWEADCRGSSVQDMIDWTESNDPGVSGVAMLALAAGMIMVIRDPDGNEQDAKSAPSDLVYAVLQQHPFFPQGRV